jgi:pimeloyl-ACP methyl ester carboxylesterase
MHIAEQGHGPLVLLVHGFPESWYSWRHQIPALADAGFYIQQERPTRVTTALIDFLRSVA